MKTLIALLLLVTPALFAADSYTPTDAERARWTMDDMRTIATTVEAYATDHHQYPQVMDMEALRALVQPMYVMSLPMHDAWGRPYRLETTPTTYRIVSAGSDGEFDPTSWSTPARGLAFTADSVLENGKITRWWAFK